MAIRNGAAESGRIVGPDTDKMFTTEVTEFTEIDHA